MREKKEACVEAVCREVQKLYFLCLPSQLSPVVSSPFPDVLGPWPRAGPGAVLWELPGNPGSAAENVSLKRPTPERAGE